PGFQRRTLIVPPSIELGRQDARGRDEAPRRLDRPSCRRDLVAGPLETILAGMALQRLLAPRQSLDLVLEPPELIRQHHATGFELPDRLHRFPIGSARLVALVEIAGAPLLGAGDEQAAALAARDLPDLALQRRRDAGMAAADAQLLVRAALLDPEEA